MVLLGDKALGTCSKVTAVGRMRAERRTTAKPWGPWKAQQLPGCTSGCGWNREAGSEWGPAPVQLWVPQEGLVPKGAHYLKDDAGRLGVVPQRDAEETEQRRLGLIGL